MISDKHISFLNWQGEFSRYIHLLAKSNNSWYEGKRLILYVKSFQEDSTIVNTKTNAISRKFLFKVIDGNNKEFNMKLYATEQEIDWIRETHLIEVVAIYIPNSSGDEWLYSPIGFSAIKSNDYELSIVGNYSISREKIKTEAKSIFRGIDRFTGKDLEPVLGFYISNYNKIPYEFYDIYWSEKKPVKSKDWLDEHINSLDAYEYNSINKVDEDNVVKKLNKRREYDSFKNASKVYLGLYKDGKLYDIKETDIVLNKNLQTINGYSADEIRVREYERYVDIAKERYGCNEISLLEKHWIRTVTKGKLTHVFDLDGNKRNSIHQEIDYKTHQINSNIMYLQNGNILLPLSGDVVKND